MKKKILIILILILIPVGVYALTNRRIINLVGKLPVSAGYPTRNKSDVKYFVVHHTDTSETTTPEQIAQFHINRSWPGIGYHFLVYPNGTIYQTNDVLTVSNHVLNNNTASVGAAFVGNHNQQEPTPKAYAAMRSLKNKLNRMFPGIEVKGHQDFKSTSCPGSKTDLSKIT